MLMGYLLFGLAPVLTGLALRAGWDAPHAVLLRFSVAGLFIALLVQIGKRSATPWVREELSLKAGRGRILFLRGLTGAAAVLCYFSAMKYAGTGVGTLLNYSYAVFANLIAAIVFKSLPRPAFWPLLALAGCGLWLVMDPSRPALDSPDFGLGLLFGLGSGVFAGAAIVTIKSLRATDNALSINAAYSLGSFLLALPAAAYSRAHGAAIPFHLALPWACLAVSAAFSFWGQMLFNHGFKGTSLPFATLISMITPALASFLGWRFLGEKLTPHFIGGALMIMAACVVMAALERPKDRQLHGRKNLI
jgi:drug/metabolite transporter (DMT)-like permease